MTWSQYFDVIDIFISFVESKNHSFEHGLSQRSNKNYLHDLSIEKKNIKQRDMSTNIPQNIVFKIKCLRKLSYNIFPVLAIHRPITNNSPYNVEKTIRQKSKS